MTEFVEEVESGDRKRALVALRHEIAEAIDGGHRCKECGRGGAAPRDLPALSLRLERVLVQLDELGDPTIKESDDDLAAKRRAKLSATAGL